jgi:hypothetical protein
MFPGNYYTDGSGKHYRCLKVTGRRVILLQFGEPVAKFDVDWSHIHLYKEIEDPRKLEHLESEYRRVKDIVEMQL